MSDNICTWVTVDEGGTLLGVSPRTMKRQCKAQKYTTKMVKGNGGKQYRILLSSLPQAAQDKYYAAKSTELVGQMADVVPTETTTSEAEKIAARHRLREQGLQRFYSLPKARQAEAKQRQLLVHACSQFIRERGVAKVAGLHAFCQQVNEGLLDLSAEVMAAIPAKHGIQHLNPASFKRWVYDYEKVGLIALANDYGKRSGRSKIEQCEPLKRYILGFILQYPHAKGKKIGQALGADKPDLPVVSDVSINRYITRWKMENAQIWTYITHPDKWKNVYMSAQGSHFENVTALNALWEMDSTPGDWLLTDGRHSVIGCIDMYSRRMTFYVSKTSSAEAVCLCFRKAVLAWGVPDRVRTDNGKDYVSNRFMDTLRDFEIPQDLCVPFASEEKGTIERHFRTMSHGLLELLPGFIGHNVAEGNQIRAAKSFAERIMTSGEVVEVEMDAAQLQATLNKWADHIYAQEPHSGLNGKTPAQMAALYAGSVRRISNIRALDVLLAEPAGTRTISKKGIRFNNYDYIGAFLTEHAGRQVTLKYDAQDAGKLFIYLEGEFIGIAEAPELGDISRQEVAVVAKKEQKKKLNQQAKELKAFKKEVAENIPELVMNHRIENADNVSHFPRPAIEHQSPALEQAATAERVASGLADEVIHAPDVIQGKAKVIEFLNTAPEVNILAMNDSEKYRYWQGLQGRLQEGDSLDDKEMNFYTRFQNTDTFRIIQEMHDDLAVKVEQ